MESYCSLMEGGELRVRESVISAIASVVPLAVANICCRIPAR
jgi:hypothetical protein